MRILDLRSLGYTAPAGPGRRRYELLVEEVAADGFFCESYGVAVTDEETGESARRRHVSVNAGEAAALLDALARNDVPPAALGDVVEDWLGR